MDDAIGPPRGRGIQIFLLAMSVLMLEVALTRVFSFIMFAHFTYLVISVAMLGFGAAGTYLTTRKLSGDARAEDEFLSRHAGRFGLASIAAVLIISRILFWPTDIFFKGDYGQLLSLLLIVIAAGMPFFFAGVCIGTIISRAGERVHRLYFADLVGAACGCLMAILMLEQLGGTASCFLVGAVGMLVAALTSLDRRSKYLAGCIVAAVLTLFVARTDGLPLYAPPDKPLFRQEETVEHVRWHPIARLDVTEPLTRPMSFGGALSHEYTGTPPLTRIIYQDAGALTGIIQPEDTPRDTAVLGYYLQGAPYQIKPDAEALAIGCGGGVDIEIALHHGARKVVGVDVNPFTIGLLRGHYSSFAKGVFQRDDVELVISEGRNFLSRDDRKFDVIQLSGVDTYTALAAGAYALTENFIYTREALDQYLAHLTPDGIVNFSRPMLTPPRETLKLAITAVEALEAQGVKEPARHLVILAGKGQGTFHPVPWAQTLIKRSPFSSHEVATLTQWARRLGFQVVYEPLSPSNSPLARFIRATPARRETLVAGHPLDVRPATDDRPFFFQFFRWRDLPTLRWLSSKSNLPAAITIMLASLVQVVVLSALLILWPLYRNSQPVARGGGRAGIFAYFAAIGLGFIIVEIALLQKFTVFLGGPAYSMAITLFAILVFSGLGSLTSRRLAADPRKLLALVVPLTCVLVVVSSLTFDGLISRMMYLSHVGRCAAAVAMVAPIGFLLGMPFPTGLRLVGRRRPELNPWAWGINACATVTGTVLCIMLSAALGFNHALQAGAVIYLAGWVAFALSQRETEQADIQPEPQP